MIGFDLEIKKLSYGLDDRRDFCRVPINTMYFEGQSLEKSRLDNYQFADALFASGRAMEMLFYSQKRYLVQNLTWGSEFFELGKLPIVCFSFRSFLETSAHLISAAEKIIKASEKYQDDVNVGKIKIDPSDNAAVDEWVLYLKTNFFDSIIADVFPTTLDFGDSIYPKTGKLQQEHKESFVAGSLNVLVPFKDGPVTGNQTISSDKEALLRPQNIITKLQKLEKNVSGLRPTYEFFSEFIHPNMYPGTAYFQLNSAVDNETYWSFESGNDGDAFAALSKFIEKHRKTFVDCVSLVLEREKKVEVFKRSLARDCKRIVRPMLKKRGMIPNEKLDLPCVCGSRKILRKCCGKV